MFSNRSDGVAGATDLDEGLVLLGSYLDNVKFNFEIFKIGSCAIRRLNRIVEIVKLKTRPKIKLKFNYEKRKFNYKIKT